MREIFQNVLDGLPQDLLPAIENELRTGQLKEHVEAHVNQARAGIENNRDHRAVEGLGRLRMRIDSTAYHYWGTRLGYKCWRDESFLKEFERDNPAVRVRCGGTKLQVGYAGQNKRFSKSYAL